MTKADLILVKSRARSTRLQRAVHSHCGELSLQCTPRILLQMFREKREPLRRPQDGDDGRLVHGSWFTGNSRSRRGYHWIVFTYVLVHMTCRGYFISYHLEISSMSELARFSGVSWKYNSSTTIPDHFLVTYCTGDVCTSQSVPGQNRSISLTGLEERHVYFVTVQAVKLWAGKAHVSPMRMTSIVAPRPEFSERVTLSASEIANLSTVS